jgi:hypothetical protein
MHLSISGHEEYVAVLEEENARLKSAGTQASKADDSSVKQLQAEGASVPAACPSSLFIPMFMSFR